MTEVRQARLPLKKPPYLRFKYLKLFEGSKEDMGWVFFSDQLFRLIFEEWLCPS